MKQTFVEEKLRGEMFDSLKKMYDTADETKFRAYLHDSFEKVKSGTARPDEVESVKWLHQNKEYADLVKIWDKRDQVAKQNTVIENVIVKKMGDNQKETKISEPGHYSLEDIKKLMIKSSRFEKEVGKIEKIERTTRRTMKEEARQAEIYMAKKALREVVDGEILPKGYWADRNGVGGGDVYRPVEYFPERLYYLDEMCEGERIAITTKNSRGLGKYWGFEIKNSRGKSFMVCESMKSRNGMYIFRMEGDDYKTDMFKTKREVYDGKLANSFEKRINHNKTYRERLIEELDKR